MDEDSARIHDATTVDVRDLSRFAIILGWGLLGLGLVVLTGWFGHIDALTSIVPGLATMKPNTALGFMLSGAFLIWGRGRLGLGLGMALASLVVLLAVLSLGQYVLAVDPGWDTWGLRSLRNAASPHRGSMSMATSCGFLMAGAAMLVLGFEHKFATWGGAMLTVLTGLLGLLGVAGYVFGVDVLYAVTPFSSMALHTAGGFLILSGGLVCVSPSTGPLGLFRSNKPGGEMLRRTIWLAIIAPLLVGSAVRDGVWSKWFGFEFGLALFAICNVLLFLVILWRTADRLNVLDEHRDALQAENNEVEKRFREMVESLPELIWTCRADGACDYLSPQWARYTGVALDGQLGDGWLGQIHADDREPARAKWLHCLATGNHFGAEFRVRRHDGVYRWFEARARPIRDEDGKVVKWFGANTDVEERHQAGRVRGHLASIIEYSNDAIVGKSLDGFVTSWNRAAERIFGYTEAEMIGQKILRLFPAGRLEEEDLILSRIAAGESVRHFRTKRLHKNGASLDISVTVSPVRDAAGRVVGASKIARDISEEIANEAALRQARDTLERRVRERTIQLEARNDELKAQGLLLDEAQRVANLGSWQLDVGTGEVQWSRQLFQIVGLDPAAAPPAYERQERMFSPDSWQRLTAAIENSITSGEGYALELEVLRPDGRPCWAVARAEVSRGKDGRVVRLNGTFQDITADREIRIELRNRQSELQRSNRELEQFAYVASHDLQEPLRAVAGCVQLLERRYGEKLGPDAAELIAHAVGGAGRMQGLIQDLLTYSRVGSGGLRVQSVDLPEVTRRAMANLASAIQESGADIRLKIDAPEIKGDAGQLTQLLQNLIGNAVKYRSAERVPEVTVSARVENAECLVAVADNGIGIESKYFDRVFAIFQRLHTRAEFSGSGIGLAICRKIVDQHGGRIWIESTPGKGSTFYFSLPQN